MALTDTKPKHEALQSAYDAFLAALDQSDAKAEGVVKATHDALGKLVDRAARAATAAIARADEEASDSDDEHKGDKSVRRPARSFALTAQPMELLGKDFGRGFWSQHPRMRFGGPGRGGHHGAHGHFPPPPFGHHGPGGFGQHGPGGFGHHAPPPFGAPGGRHGCPPFDRPPSPPPPRHRHGRHHGPPPPREHPRGRDDRPARHPSPPPHHRGRDRYDAHHTLGHRGVLVLSDSDGE